MESYNVKITAFANGTYELRHYSTVIGADYIEYQDTEKPDGFYSIPPKKRAEPEKEYNPFTERYESLRTVEDWERSLASSLNRTRNEIYPWARQCRWEWFVTLTFDGAKTERESYSACMERTAKWFNNQKQRHAPELKYLYVPEQHKKGGWHIHGVMADTGSMLITDSGRVSFHGKACRRNAGNSMCPVIYNLSGWRYGFSTATEVADAHRVSTYILKYITKELVADTPYRHRYFRSRNLPKPEEHTYIIDMTEPDAVAEFLRKFEDSTGAELVHEKSVSGQYTAVDYKYYRVNESETVGKGEKEDEGNEE